MLEYFHSDWSVGEGNGNPLQYSYLENPMDGGAWWATVHGVSKSRTRLSDFAFRSGPLVAPQLPWILLQESLNPLDNSTTKERILDIAEGLQS